MFDSKLVVVSILRGQTCVGLRFKYFGTFSQSNFSCELHPSKNIILVGLLAEF
jgi:hypothetical protein